METNLVLEAFKFMILGMGIVFTFLVVMIFALKLQAKLIGKYFPEKKKEPIKPINAQSKTDSKSEKAKVAAISAAVQHHNNLKG